MTISVQDLSFNYDKRFPVLDRISFTMKKGQFFGVFGPNGGGKTTLLKLLLGLLTPKAGSIQMLDSDPRKIRDQIGYVPQVRQLDKKFPISVLEVVLQGCLSKHRGFGNYSQKLKKIAMESLEKVGLSHLYDQHFGTLSGGQIQRALIARALASNPKILLLDEATVGIDPETLQQIFKFLIGLKGEITILLVTHELQAIASEMDRLLCINHGLTPYSPSEICGHFAIGLYHPPLKDKEDQRGLD